MMAPPFRGPIGRSTPAPLGLAEGTHLFVMLALAADVARSWAQASADDLVSTLHLAFFIHIGLSLYLGVRGAARTATWLALIAAFATAHAATFLGYVLPWGQVRFWLAATFADAPLVGEALAEATASGNKVWPAAGLLLIAADAVAMHAPRWRNSSRRTLVTIAVAAVATAVLAAVAIERLAPQPLESAMDHPDVAFSIVPAWHALPFYTMLRAVPDKVGGVIVVLAAMLAPMAWPWARAERLRVGGSRWGWRLACVTMALAWAGLWLLGATAPVEPWLTSARVLTVLWFGFVLSPFVLRARSARTASGSGSAL